MTDDVIAGMREFCERLKANDVASFEDVVSSEAKTLVIGTAPGEWVTERDRLRYGFEVDGYYIELEDPVAFASGDLGWLADRPTFHFPGDSTIKCRMTTVLHREADRWKVMHMHVSVGVPDEEVAELQERWGGET